ncbi:MAG: hypothetical protein L6R39_002675 [Caloplaca ligustica]|nr:MAG: hypothetical protein L6R39_002675 [Caloplaca ligustica]
MASQERVVVPAHTPKPLPGHLRSELTSALLSASAIPVIQSTLHDESEKVGWTKSIRERAKQLINNGQATTSQEIVEILIKESCERPGNQLCLPGGLRRTRQGQVDGSEAAKAANGAIVVNFPEQAIVEGKKAIRDALDPVIEVESIASKG